MASYIFASKIPPKYAPIETHTTCHNTTKMLQKQYSKLINNLSNREVTMLYNTKFNFFTFILSSFLIFTLHTAVANPSTLAKQQPTIFATSISWDDEQAREKLLSTALEWEN